MSSYDYEDEGFSRRPRRTERDYFKKYKNRIYDIIDEDDDVLEDDDYFFSDEYYEEE